MKTFFEFVRSKLNENEFSLGDNSYQLAQQLGINLDAIKLAHYKKTGSEMSPMEIDSYLNQIKNQKQIANNQQGYAKQNPNFAVNPKDYF